MKQEKPVSVAEEQKAPSESVSPPSAAGARGLQVSHWTTESWKFSFASVCLQSWAGVVSCRKGVPQGAALPPPMSVLRSDSTLPSMNSLVPFQNLVGDCFLIGSIFPTLSSSLLEKHKLRGSQEEKFCQCGCVSLCNSSQKLLLWFSLEQLTVDLEHSCLVLCLSLAAQASARVAKGAADHETGPGRSQHGQGSPSAGDQEVQPPVPALRALPGTGDQHQQGRFGHFAAKRVQLQD